MSTMNEKVKKEIKRKAVNGKLPCMTARMIAEELGVPYETVGKAADKLKVKIINCQLGCF